MIYSRTIKGKIYYFTEYCIDKLKNNLVGIYLHGSLAMGCFNPDLSDIDILIVVKKDFSFMKKRELIDFILKLSGTKDKNDFEISLILEDHAKNFIYPTPYILHYSRKYKDMYLSNTNFVCSNGVDFDLAAHITVINSRGICLAGKPIEKVFGNIPESNYVDSITRDVEDAKEKILSYPIYYILNLCRVLYYLKEGIISSKKEGGEWGILNLPEQFRNIIKSALLIYTGSNEPVEIDTQKLMIFTDYMLEEISKNKV